MGEIIIRGAEPFDAERLLTLRLALDRETELMLLERDERSRDTEEHRARLASLLGPRNCHVWVALDGDVVVGFLQARGGPFRRNAHVADVVIGVLQSHAGRRIGRRLFGELESWAPRAGVSRLELTVMAHNDYALRLYRAVGFQEEGRKRASLRVRGAFVDEIVMGKLLP